LVGPPGCQFFVACIAIVGVIKSGDDGAPEKSEFAIANEPRALPYSGGNKDLNLLIGEQIVSEDDDGGAAIGMKLKHLDGVAQIKVEDFIGIEQVHFRELIVFEEIVDRSAWGAEAAGQMEGGRRCPGLAEAAAFDGVGIELEQGLYLFSGHSEIVNQPLKLSV
jgi:hypothetical protein